jgi:hypothetical protein
MDERDGLREESPQEATSHLSDSLKSCNRLVASYRSLLTNEPEKPETDPQTKPEDQRLESTARTSESSGS